MLYNLSALAGRATRARFAKRAFFVMLTTVLTTALLNMTFVPASAQDQGQPPNQQHDQHQNQSQGQQSVQQVQQQVQQQSQDQSQQGQSQQGQNQQGQNQQGQNQQGNLDWPYYGNDLGNMRFQDVDQINTGNVTELQPAWVVYTGVGSQATSFESQPIVVDGTMYVSSPHDHVLAIDAATGNVKWTYAPNDMPSLDELAICCGQTNRGVAVGDGKVFIARLDAKLVAIDAATGKQLWAKAVAPYAKEFTETMAPQYYDGKVFVGISGGEHRIRGFVSAYDAKSGDLLWRFFTIPGPGEFGHDTWTEDSWQWGGAPVWSTPAVDKDLNQLIFATGNAAPDLSGADRAGDNLFTASIVSVDIQTGKLNWYFQEVHHDIWDYDGPQPVALFTVQKDGQQIPAVGHANKNGYYYILDRRNGSPVFDVTETPVPTDPAWQHPSPTQPIPATQELIPHEVSGQVVISDAVTAKFYTPPQEQPLIMQPGAESGSEWPPAAFSPRTGYVYVPAGGYEPWYYKSAPDNFDNLGSTLEDKPSYKTADHYGLFDALDTTTGKLAWQVKAPNRVASGVAVAGDLVFWGQSNGIFNATDAQSGHTLWSFACSTYQGPHQDDIQQSCNADGSKDGEHAIGGANGAPAVYTINGREYVVMAFGGNTQVRSGQVSPPGDALIAFALPSESGAQTGQAAQQNQGQQNQGQQNQGQQNQGQQNQGQQGQGQQNQGTQNQGMQNQGMQNQGMQNQGMQMGSSGPTTVDVTETSFKIALSMDSVPAGTVTFHVKNQAEAVPHQLTVIKTDKPADQLPTSDNKVDTSSLNVVGSSDNIQAGGNQDLTVDLTPGTYVLICNLPSHYQNGMYTSFTVQGAQGQQNQGQQNQGQQNQGQQNQGQQIRVSRARVSRTRVSRTKVSRARVSRARVSRTRVSRTRVSRTRVSRTRANRTKVSRTRGSRIKRQAAKLSP